MDSETHANQDAEALDDAAVYVISAAAELAGMHPQTLRQYDRLGLVQPRRTAGRGRRYSLNDIAQLRLIQRLSQDAGINLAGIKRILQLQRQNQRLRKQNRQLKQALVHAQHVAESVRSQADRTFAASANGNIVSYRKGRSAASNIPVRHGEQMLIVRGRNTGRLGLMRVADITEMRLFQ